MRVTVDFCGEQLPVQPGRSVIIGREGDIELGDNPYLHRRFLEVSVEDELVWLINQGTALSATVVDDASRLQAWLAPGARLPIVFRRAHVRFAAGPTSYEFDVHVDGAPFSEWIPATGDAEGKLERTATVEQPRFTPDQHLLVVALAEPLLRQDGRGTVSIPPSADVARRLGWTQTKFTRKLDNVCAKLERSGVPGLHGDAGQLASNRRARLVDYALAAGIVTLGDLALLDDLDPTGSGA